MNDIRISSTSSSDGSIVRFDGTTAFTIESSGILISDTDDITGAESITSTSLTTGSIGATGITTHDIDAVQVDVSNSLGVGADASGTTGKITVSGGNATGYLTFESEGVRRGQITSTNSSELPGLIIQGGTGAQTLAAFRQRGLSVTNSFVVGSNGGLSSGTTGQISVRGTGGAVRFDEIDGTRRAQIDWTNASEDPGLVLKGGTGIQNLLVLRVSANSMPNNLSLGGVAAGSTGSLTATSVSATTITGHDIGATGITGHTAMFKNLDSATIAADSIGATSIVTHGLDTVTAIAQNSLGVGAAANGTTGSLVINNPAANDTVNHIELQREGIMRGAIRGDEVSSIIGGIAFYGGTGMQHLATLHETINQFTKRVVVSSGLSVGGPSQGATGRVNIANSMGVGIAAPGETGQAQFGSIGVNNAPGATGNIISDSMTTDTIGATSGTFYDLNTEIMGLTSLEAFHIGVNNIDVVDINATTIDATSVISDSVVGDTGFFARIGATGILTDSIQTRVSMITAGSTAVGPATFRNSIGVGYAGTGVTGRLSIGIQGTASPGAIDFVQNNSSVGRIISSISGSPGILVYGSTGLDLMMAARTAGVHVYNSLGVGNSPGSTGNIISNSMTTGTIGATGITGHTAMFKNMDSAAIIGDTIGATSGTFYDLNTEIMGLTSLEAFHIGVNNIDVVDINATTIDVSTLNATTLDADDITSHTLGTTSINTQGLTAARTVFRNGVGIGHAGDGITGSLIINRMGAASLFRAYENNIEHYRFQTVDGASPGLLILGNTGALSMMQMTTTTGVQVHNKMGVGGAPSGATGNLHVYNNLVMGTTGIPANATDRFIYLPHMPGTPSGTPTTHSGTAPIAYNKTHDELYVFASPGSSYWSPVKPFYLNITTDSRSTTATSYTAVARMLIDFTFAQRNGLQFMFRAVLTDGGGGGTGRIRLRNVTDGVNLAEYTTLTAGDASVNADITVANLPLAFKEVDVEIMCDAGGDTFELLCASIIQQGV